MWPRCTSRVSVTCMITQSRSQNAREWQGTFGRYYFGDGRTLVRHPHLRASVQVAWFRTWYREGNKGTKSCEFCSLWNTVRWRPSKPGCEFQSVSSRSKTMFSQCSIRHSMCLFPSKHNSPPWLSGFIHSGTVLADSTGAQVFTAVVRRSDLDPLCGEVTPPSRDTRGDKIWHSIGTSAVCADKFGRSFRQTPSVDV